MLILNIFAGDCSINKQSRLNVIGGGGGPVDIISGLILTDLYFAIKYCPEKKRPHTLQTGIAEARLHCRYTRTTHTQRQFW